MSFREKEFAVGVPKMLLKALDGRHFIPRAVGGQTQRGFPFLSPVRSLFLACHNLGCIQVRGGPGRAHLGTLVEEQRAWVVLCPGQPEVRVT